MPAAIANYGGRDLSAFHREPAWHNLGEVFHEEITAFQSMLVMAGLANWNVRKIPAREFLPGYTFAKDIYFIVATINGEDVVLGTALGRYEIVQNEDMFSFLQSLHDGATWETAGALKGGTTVFGTIAFDREIVLDPTGVGDVVKTFLLVTGSHDGTGAVRGGRTPVRVVCENTLNIALPGLSQSFSFRHTASVEQRMALAAEEWRKNNVYFDRFEEEAKRLFETPATDKQFFSIVEDLFPKPEKDVKGAIKKWENKMETYSQAWKMPANAGIRNTAWGVFNALTEANQWGRNMQKTDNGSENFFSAGAGFDGPTNAFRQDAFNMAMALV